MIYILILLLLLFFRNFSFTIFFAPVSMFYFYKRAQNSSTKKASKNDILNFHTSSKSSIKNIIYSYLTGFCRYYLWRLSYIPSHHYRNFIYRKICKMDLKKGAVIYYGCEIREPSKIHIGERAIIGDNSILDGRNEIYIGEDVVFASNVRIWTEQHDHRDPWFRCETQEKKTSHY